MSTERDVEEGFGWVCRTGTCFRGWAEGGKMLRLSGLDYAGWVGLGNGELWVPVR